MAKIIMYSLIFILKNIKKVHFCLIQLKITMYSFIFGKKYTEIHQNISFFVKKENFEPQHSYKLCSYKKKSVVIWFSIFKPYYNVLKFSGNKGLMFLSHS